MPVGLLPALLALAILMTLGSAYYLLINARSVAAMFNRSSNEIAPGPRGRQPPPRGRLLAAMALFGVGTVLSMLVVTQYGTEPVREAVESRPEEVQRP
ncbi:MAG TPA: hypothetical protein VFO69_01355 [Allosphingosinicella sp.]|nr:hypothetical protein [Allosphingosinicella sp.]